MEALSVTGCSSKNSAGGVADADAVDGAERRELNILSEGMEVPAPHALDDLRGDEVTRAGNRAGGSADHARVVEVARLADEPGGIGGADPGAAEVLRVTVAGEGEVALVEGVVHDADVIAREKVVGIEDEEGLVLAGILPQDAVEAVVHDPALALARKVVSLVDDRSGLASRLGGVIGACIGDDEDVDQLRRIVLVPNRADEVSDDGLLVMRGDEERIGMLLLRRRNLNLSLDEADEEENDLVKEAQAENDADKGVEDDDWGQGSLPKQETRVTTNQFTGLRLAMASATPAAQKEQG